MVAMSTLAGNLLKVTVVGCNKLKDLESISTQDQYVCLEYNSSKFCTRTCTDGGKNPTFQEKFVFSFIKGLREMNIAVWNTNTLAYDDFIGSAKVDLQKVLSHGYDDIILSLHTRTGRYAGDVQLILHYSETYLDDKPRRSCSTLVPPDVAQQVYYNPEFLKRRDEVREFLEHYARMEQEIEELNIYCLQSAIREIIEVAIGVCPDVDGSGGLIEE